MKHLFRLLAAAALALPVQAQAAYDLILPTDVGLPGGPSSTGHHFGILVNTGTEPLYVSDWSMSRGFARTDQLWAPFEVDAGPVSSGQLPLAPGSAIGTGTPEMMALLEQDEHYHSTETILILGRLGPELPTAGPVRCEVALRSTLFLDDLERELRFDLRLHATQGSQPVLQGAQRVSATLAAPLIEQVAMGCTAPGLGQMGLELVAPFDPNLPPSRIGYGSDLPMLGNEHAVLVPHALYDPQYEGTPWILVASRDGATVTFGGCDVLRPGPTASVLASGVYTHGQFLFADLGEVPLPIPDAPALEGSQLTLQVLLLTPAAPNGRCAASAGLRLTFESL